MVLPRFLRGARASAGESVNRTTFPSTTAVAYMTSAYAKTPTDIKSPFRNVALFCPLRAPNRGFLRQATAAARSSISPDLLSQILKVFNDQFGNIPWTDADRVHKLITEEIPNRVAADKAYQNAKQYSDKQNARIEHDKALARVMTAVLKDDTELFSSSWTTNHSGAG